MSYTDTVFNKMNNKKVNMKTLIILSGIMFIGFGLFAQNKVTYDFKTKEPPLITPSFLGQNTVFKIDNINKFLYDVKIICKQTEYNSDPPSVFSQVFSIEKRETTDVGKEAEKVAQEQTESGKTETVKTKSNIESSMYFNKLMLDAYKKELDEIEILPDSLQEDKKITELRFLVDKHASEIEEQKVTISKLNNVINDEYSKIVQELYSKSLNIQTSFELLEEAKVLKNRLVLISMTDGLNFSEVTSQANELIIKYPFAKDLYKLLSSFSKSYKEFKSSYELYLINEKVKQKFVNDETKIKASVNSLLSEIEDLKKTIDDYNYSMLFQNINILFTELNNQNNFFSVSDPVQAEKDLINFDVKITPRKNITSSSALETRDFSTSVPIEGGVKIDFSTGLFMTTGLYNRQYSVTESNSDKTNSIISEDSNNSIANVSLGALMHISPRCTSSFKPGFTFGFGLNSTDITNANVFVGGSAIFGNNERFIVSTGLSLANVDYIKGKYSLNSEIKTTTIETELTEKATRAGLFLSFTYNLTNKKKE